MVYLNLTGSGFQTLSLQNLSSTQPSVSSDRRRWVAADLQCHSSSFLCSATSLASVFGGIGTKLVSCYFQSSWSSDDFSHVLFSGVSVNSTCGKGSVGVATHHFCVSRWSCNRPWEGEGGNRKCPGFCSSSCLHPEKFLLWDWDWHVEHFHCCRRCC